MDPTLHRFGITSATDSTPCSFDGVSLRGGVGACVADNASFQRLVLELGNSIASAGLAPARTVGYRHFYVGVEVSMTQLHGAGGTARPDQAAGTPDEWSAYQQDNFLHLGTVGANGGTSTMAGATDRYQTGNRFTNSNLVWTRLAFRKGLPLGLELGGSVGRVLDTSLWAFTFEVKWALFEGFRSRWPAAIPDLAVRGSVSTLTGLRGFSLTVPTFDVILSKGFVLGDTVTLTPYVAGQMIWIMADSEVVDVTPGNLADNEGEASLVTFERVREWHPRILAGLQMQYTRFVVNGAFRYDLGNPARGFSAIPNAPKQWSIDVGVGLVY